jgi:hypothetical protein
LANSSYFSTPNTGNSNCQKDLRKKGSSLPACLANSSYFSTPDTGNRNSQKDLRKKGSSLPACLANSSYFSTPNTGNSNSQKLGTGIRRFKIVSSLVADPHHFNIDSYHFNADPDTAFNFMLIRIQGFHFKADPDHAPNRNDANLRPLLYRQSMAPF